MNWVPARRPSTSSKYSSNLARSRPRSVSPNSLDHGLQVHLQTRSITASKCMPNSLDHCLQVYQQTRSITACKFTRSWPPSAYLQTRSITASKSISELCRLLPSSASSKSLDYRLQAHLQSRSIMASEYISEFTRSSFSGTPRITLKHRLHPVQI